MCLMRESERVCVCVCVKREESSERVFVGCGARERVCVWCEEREWRVFVVCVFESVRGVCVCVCVCERVRVCV